MGRAWTSATDELGRLQVAGQAGVDRAGMWIERSGAEPPWHMDRVRHHHTPSPSRSSIRHGTRRRIVMIRFGHSRRLAQPACVLATYVASSPASSACPCLRTMPCPSPCRRGLSTATGHSAPATNNPLLDEYLDRRRATPKQTQQPEEQQTLRRGDLPSSSIFEIDRTQRGEPVPDAADAEPTQRPLRDPAALATVLDPQPDQRRQWERKMVIRSIQRGGRLNETQLIRRTERQSLSKSHFLKTSVKKLGALARQVAGKPVEDAIVQMRFSKKKAATDIRKHLEYARDEAIVRRGMGLGRAEGRAGTPIDIALKDGTITHVTDRTGIYIDQAWVGRGTFTDEPEFRARGNVNVLRRPETSISVLLKEEATRVREAAKRRERRENRKLWVQLPDRPVTAQRQYCLW